MADGICRSILYNIPLGILNRKFDGIGKNQAGSSESVLSFASFPVGDAIGSRVFLLGKKSPVLSLGPLFLPLGGGIPLLEVLSGRIIPGEI